MPSTSNPDLQKRHDSGAPAGSADARAAFLARLDLTDPFAAAALESRMPTIITDPRDADNPIVFANMAFCHLTGYALEDVLGRNCRFLQGPETDSIAVARIFAAIAAQRPIEIDIRNYRKDGTAFWNRLLIAPIFDAAGTLTYFFSNQIDVTAERERIAELQAHNDALMEFASLLAARTTELIETNEKLKTEIEERERAEAALRQLHKMETIGQLTGGIAHDFNNLLSGIIGSLELLEHRIEAGATDDLKQCAAAAMVAANRAATLTQRLLGFARRQPLKPERTDLNRVLAHMEELLQRTLGPRIDIHLYLANGLLASCCDPNLLEHAILNLAINARDAMPAGGSLTIGTSNAFVTEGRSGAEVDGLLPGRYVAISVTDTGIGMQPEIMARAFEPFFTTKPVGKGTGMGLSMVYGFAKQSGGVVKVRSKPGYGTTFKVYLPQYDDARTQASTNSIVAAPLARRPGRRAATVLIVEDESTFRMVVNETLLDLGYTTLQAEDGLSALRILQSNSQIDLLISDIGLPGMDGRQLAGAVHRIRPNLPILFVTGYGDDDAILDMLNPGLVTKVLTKPFTMQTLVTSVLELLPE